jgi:hypothetical protein
MTKKEMFEEGEMLVIRNFKFPLSIWNSLGKNSVVDLNYAVVRFG